MKKFITLLLCIILSLDIIDNKYLNNELQSYIQDIYLNRDYYIYTNVDALEINEYKYKNFSDIVSDTENFKPNSKQDLLNIYYTVLNNGYNNFSFYCSDSYKECLKDVENLSNDKSLFSYLNQIIHPFNSFDTIESNYSSDGRIEINVNKKYGDDDIDKIKEKLNEIVLKLNINSYNNINDKIKVFHDYIADTNKYDSNRADNDDTTYKSNSALGTLFEGYSICSGYTDTLALFLDMLGLDNIKVATEDHVWNAVKIDNTWYHIDLTWDDPITNTKEDIIQYDYFLITTDELLNKNDNEHNFSTKMYDFIN